MKKKIALGLLVCFALLFTSCEFTLGEIFNLGDADTITPPSWVYGTWEDDTDLTLIKAVLSEDNFIYEASDGVFTENYKDWLNILAVKTEETSDSNSYEIIFSYLGDTWTYTFEQVTATTLDFTYSNDVDGLIDSATLTLQPEI